MAGTNVGGIYGEISLDDKGFKQVLSQSKAEMARAALDMQKSSRVKMDLSEFKKLSGQMAALQQRAQETRIKLNQAFQHGAETKELQGELRKLTQRIKLLKDTTEPARKEMERLKKAGQGVSGGKGPGALQGIGGAVGNALPGNLGGMLAAGGGNPYAVAATAAIAGLTGVTAAAYKAATATGAYAEEILNLSQQTGMGTTRLQELKVISENAGVSFDTMTNAITQVQRKLMGMEEGSGPAAEAMQRLGINIKDSSGQLRSMDSLFPELLKKLQSMENVSERNMLAAQIFGRGFGELAPLLGMTAAEFDAARQKAHDLGLVLSSSELARAAEFDDQMDELRQTMAGLGREIGSAVIPVFSSLAKKLLEAWPKIKAAVSNWWSTAKPMFTALWGALKQVWEILKPVVALLGLNGIGQASIQIKLLTAAFRVLEEVLKGIKTILEPVLAAIGWVAEKAAGLMGIGGAPGGKNAGAKPAGSGDLTGAPAGGGTASPAGSTAGIPYIARAGDRPGLIDQAMQVALDAYNEMQRKRATVLQKMLDDYREWARKMADAMKSFGAATLQEAKEQLRSEASTAKSKYDKLAEIGAAGVAAMTNVRMFAGKDKEPTAADLTPDRIAKAAEAVRANRANQAAMSDAVNAQLFGDSARRLAAIGGAKSPDMQGMGVGQQVSLLTRLVELTMQELEALKMLSRGRVTT